MIALVESTEYFNRLLADVKNAKKRIYIVSLNIACDDTTQPLFDALENACNNGINVCIATDTHVFLELANKVFGPIPPAHPSGDRTREAFKKLKIAGAYVKFVGRSNMYVPYRGRTHAKWSIVDDTVYTFGGVNLYGHGLENKDYMFQLSSGTLADDLCAQQHSIMKSREGYKGYVKQFKFGELHIDSGQKFDSSIYRRACELALECESFIYVSQYYPRGMLYKTLKKKQGKFYINRGDSAPTTASKIMVRSGDFLTNLDNSYLGKQYLHAKYMLFTMPDGSTVALTGSHNFSYLGVAFGTIEIALATIDQEIVSNLKSFANTL